MTIESVCPKCVTIAKSGKPSCCGRGGSWFRNCGGGGNKRFKHTWKEGIYACKARSRSKTALAQQNNGVQPKDMDSSYSSDKTTPATKPLVFASADRSTSTVTTANTSASRAVSIHSAYATQSANSKETDGSPITGMSIPDDRETPHPISTSRSTSVSTQGYEKMFGIVLHVILLVMIAF